MYEGEGRPVLPTSILVGRVSPPGAPGASDQGGSRGGVLFPLSLPRAERPVVTFAGTGDGASCLRARNRHFLSRPQLKSSCRPPTARPGSDPGGPSSKDKGSIR